MLGSHLGPKRIGYPVVLVQDTRVPVEYYMPYLMLHIHMISCFAKVHGYLSFQADQPRSSSNEGYAHTMDFESSVIPPPLQNTGGCPKAPTIHTYLAPPHALVRSSFYDHVICCILSSVEA
jgi:hypothetical protein